MGEFNWRRLRQQGFLTMAIIVGSTMIADLLLPHMTVRQVLMLIALVALLIGWVP